METSSLCPQLCWAKSLCSHSARLDSEPVHRKLSIQISPSPGPYSWPNDCPERLFGKTLYTTIINVRYVRDDHDIYYSINQHTQRDRNRGCDADLNDCPERMFSRTSYIKIVKIVNLRYGRDDYHSINQHTYL